MNASKDSLTGQSNSANGYSKVKKNHFITQYPDEMFFMQCGVQDRAGNMWFGSAGDGIYYYDGNNFLNFTKNDGLCHNDILCCHEDRSGIIWFGTRNGVILYKPTGKPPVKSDFKSFLISENIIRAGTREKVPYTYILADNFLWDIYQDEKGQIWFSTNKGLYICDPKTDLSADLPVFISFLDKLRPKNENQFQQKEAYKAIQDDEGNMWFIMGGGPGENIACYNGEVLTWVKPNSEEFIRGPFASFRSIMRRRNGDLLFLHTTRGVYSYNQNVFSNLAKKIGLENDTLVCMAEDKQGNLWFGHSGLNMKNGGDGGVWRFDGKSLKLFTTKDGLSHNCVFCIIPDKDGNVWFGTRNTGLCRYDGKTFVDFTE